MRKRTSGYTLLELSVVIAVLGIVGGGIFVAQALVRASYLNRILSEYDTYIKAYNEFHEKFLAYPGDMNNAVTMWGLDPNGCVWPNTNTVQKTATCNGNGDGKIGDSDASGNLSNSLEWFRAWQHMGNARFIPDRFTGVPGAGGVAEARPPSVRLGTGVAVLAGFIFPLLALVAVVVAFG
jgi:prepilin-type N-terminal cleavage/methylation domain-containing protein